MEGTKLEVSAKEGKDPPAATYKAIPEADMEEQAVTRPKSLVKMTSGTPEHDGADEKMLPEGNGSPNNIEIRTSPSEANGEAKLNIDMAFGDLKGAFVGMTKEELMKYANDPFWVRLRWFLFVAFWLLWAAMLFGAISIIYVAPKCNPPPPRTWWEEGPLTKSPASLDELKVLKTKGFKGAIIDYIEDVYEPHERFLKMLGEAKREGIKVIVAVEPGSSNKWFEQNGKEDYYVWTKGKTVEGKEAPINNWLNEQNQSSWLWSSSKGKFYYAPKGVPQLNFYNPEVQELFSGVLKQFIEKGAAGVSLKGASKLLYDKEFKDEELNPSAIGFTLGTYGFYLHSRTENVEGLSGLLYSWRKSVKNGTNDVVFMLNDEVPSLEAFKLNNSLVVDLPVLGHVLSKPVFKVEEVANSLNSSFNIDGVTWPLWKVNSSALPKDVIDIFTYLLPGASFLSPKDKINESLIKLRESPSIMRGVCSVHAVANKTAIAYIRVTSGNPGTLVALNPSEERVEVDFPNDVPALYEVKEVTVQLYSSGYNETEFMDVNAKKSAFGVPISPKSAIVLSYVPKKHD